VELSAHRRVAVGRRDRNWRSRRAWLSCAAALLAIALAGCVAAVPTEAEVLDGAAFASKRSTAAEEAKAFAQGVAADSGVLMIGEQSGLMCTEGQNNQKRRDGYGLKCDADDTVYLAWLGDSQTTASRIEQVISRDCSILETMPTSGPPLAGIVSFGLTYDCSDGLLSSVAYAGTGTLGENGWLADPACDSQNVRCAGPRTEAEISARARPYSWVARITTIKNVYTEVIQ
jgi:hypothetical protein